jgi:hypothetical protein
MIMSRRLSAQKASTCIAEWVNNLDNSEGEDNSCGSAESDNSDTDVGA